MELFFLWGWDGEGLRPEREGVEEKEEGFVWHR